jgi:hypothetical protein
MLDKGDEHQNQRPMRGDAVMEANLDMHSQDYLTENRHASILEILENSRVIRSLQESTSGLEDGNQDMLRSISLALEEVVGEIKHNTSVLLTTRDAIRENIQMTQEVMQMNHQILSKLMQPNQKSEHENIRKPTAHRRPSKENKTPRDLTDSGSDEDSSAEYSNDDESLRADEIMGNTQHEKSRTVRIPHFTGKENWKTWINRFEDLAERNRWSANDATLLPRTSWRFCFWTAIQENKGKLSSADRRARK